MNGAISISSNNNTSEHIKKLWEQVSLFEDKPSMVSLSYPPHFTFGIFSDVRMELLEHVVKDVFGGQSAIRIHFDSISIFDNDPLVLWAKPENPELLFEFHELIHEFMKSVDCHEHYLPTSWIPHCTLGTNIKKRERENALEIVAKLDAPFDVIFDAADWISFPPVNVAGRVELVAEQNSEQ